MVNYNPLREHIQEIDGNYPYSMPTWLIILTTVLGTLMLGARILIFLYCKHKNAPTCSKSSSLFWQKENTKETKPMFTNQCPTVKANPEMVKEALEILGIDFGDFDKCKPHRNRRMEAN